MLRVIREARPRWIIGENVAGIISLALDQVLADLENENYTLQTFVIPAASIGAPHRRDRVWVVGHDDTDASCKRAYGRGIHEDDQLPRRSVLSHLQAKRGKTRGKVRADFAATSRDTAYAQSAGQPSGTYGPGKVQFWGSSTGYDWLAVAASLCRVDDGFPGQLDGRELTAKQHRIERIKALGNAIVPQVAAEVMRGIKIADDLTLLY
jgi:DNA (cytosine-5)-methyltransferase 1